MSSTSLRSRRSCSERSLSNSPGSSVIGVSLRSAAHCSRVKMRYGLYLWSGARISMSPSLFNKKLLALTRRFFVQSGRRRALRQRSLNVLKLDAPRLQQHQQVIDNVGAFGDEMLAIV